MTRLHAHTLELVAEDLAPDAGAPRWLLRSPAPGWFRPIVGVAAWCDPGSAIGTLDILGRTHLLVVPPGVSGATESVESAEPPAGLTSRPVAYRDPIAQLSTQSLTGAVRRDPAAAAASAAPTPEGTVFRAPTSGRFYSRSTPDKPPFVEAGAQLTHGATICLLEVMKTFHRVTYGGAGLPDTARVRRVLVHDGDDVNAGDPLLALEP